MVKEETWKRLLKIKIIPAESVDSIIDRLLFYEQKSFDKIIKERKRLSKRK